jgi:predicted RND superfamily exporter protein
LNALIQVILAFSVRRPVAVAAIILPLILICILGIFRIGFDDGLKSVFASDSQAFQNYAASSKEFAHSETDIAVLFSSKVALDGQSLAVLQDFVIEAQFIDGIEAVFSIFSLRQRDPESGQMVSLFPNDLSETAKVQAALQKVNSLPGTGAKVVSADKKQTVVILSLGEDMADMTGSSAILQELRTIADEMTAERDVSIGFTGLLSVRDQIIQGLKSDQIRINILGALAGFVISFVVLRSFWVTVLNTLVPVSALILCLGAFGWFGMSINALTNALPVLILVLASSDSIHLTFEVRHRMAEGLSVEDAVRISVRDVSGPCVLTSLTTVLAFATLLYSDSPVVREMAQAGMVGVVLSMFAVLFVHPLVFVLGGRYAVVRKAMPLRRAKKPPFITRAALFRPVLKHARLVSSFGFMATFVALYLFLPVQPSYRFMENIDPELSVAKVRDEVEKIAGPITTIDIPVRVAAGTDRLSPEVLNDLTRLHDDLEHVEGVEGVISLVSLIRQIDVPDGEARETRIQEILDQLPGRFRNRMLGEDAGNLQIMLLVKDSGSSEVLAVRDRAVAVLEQDASTVLQAGDPTGFLVMSAELSSVMIRQLTVSFLIAALICPFVIALWFRRLDFALAAVVPNVLPIVLVGAVLTLSGQGVQFTSALALTIAFGIALDDSIHVFNRLKLLEARSRKPLTRQIILDATRHVAPVLLTTTVILSAGLLMTQVSAMPMIRFFGLLCIATFVLALLCDLFILPALVAWFSTTDRSDRMSG